ncbi:MAG: hypothetical protein Q4F21_15190 [Lachnospiraceae bacterium]|nr:hypothetical protein [Lachnospiraceae bacterium]
MKKKFMTFLLTASVLLLLPVLIFIFRIRNSVKITARSTILPCSVIYFQQKDPEWGDNTLGSSSFTMSSSGCLTTCLAAEIQMQYPEISEPFTPGQLNSFFSQSHVYDREGNILWDCLEQATSLTVVRKNANALDTRELESLLENNCFPILRVRVNSLGSFHYVLLTGCKDGEFLCMDPLNEKAEAVPLSNFGNRIYGIRYVLL